MNEVVDHYEFYDYPAGDEGKRVSYDGALCTIQCLLASGDIPGTRGEWLGVEWDDVTRGRHNGVYNGRRYFDCESIYPTVASFIRLSRKADPERTVLEAIRHKYESNDSVKEELVVISGKVAEEIGFDKISREQSVLADLRIVLLDQLVVNGIAPRGSSAETIKQAQLELIETCPSIVELDLGYNPIEKWSDVEDICKALPRLRVLKLNSIRLTWAGAKDVVDIFGSLQELHLNECLIRPIVLEEILGTTQFPRFPNLHTLWLSQNEFKDSRAITTGRNRYTSVSRIMLENNFFTTLNSLHGIFTVFPNAKHISLQSNQIEEFGEVLLPPDETGPPQTYPNLETINLSHNKIETMDFVDKLPLVFPNLISLRISNNPVYDHPNPITPAANASETNYYLTLARLAKLKTLNYTTITPRERDEGEIYYLSIVEKEISMLLPTINSSDSEATKQQLDQIATKFPRYQLLCEKHDRESILTQFSSSDTSNKPSLLQPSKPIHPPGSLASRLVTATFYIPQSQISISSRDLKTTSFTRPIVTTIPTTQLFALIAQNLSLLPLQFRLIYESPELDPVRDDLTTRSQIHSSTTMDVKQRWKEWGQWDVDHLVDNPTKNPDDMANQGTDEGFWNAEGYLLKDGKKWKRREVEILLGMKAWGDYLDLDLEQEDKEVRVRIELKGYMIKK